MDITGSGFVKVVATTENTITFDLYGEVKVGGMPTNSYIKLESGITISKSKVDENEKITKIIKCPTIE